MANLTLDIKTKIPTEEEILELAIQLESEMYRTKLNTETAYEFRDELRRRVTELFEIEVSHPVLTLSGK